MDYKEEALEALGRDYDNNTAAFIYAMLAIVEQLERIDDALRNTVGGRS